MPNPNETPAQRDERLARERNDGHPNETDAQRVARENSTRTPGDSRYPNDSRNVNDPAQPKNRDNQTEPARKAGTKRPDGSVRANDE